MTEHPLRRHHKFKLQSTNTPSHFTTPLTGKATIHSRCTRPIRSTSRNVEPRFRQGWLLQYGLQWLVNLNNHLLSSRVILPEQIECNMCPIQQGAFVEHNNVVWPEGTPFEETRENDGKYGLRESLILNELISCCLASLNSSALTC